MTPIVAFANQKGGVGKTTTVVNLGAILASLGLRILIIDLDPQGNASTSLGISPCLRHNNIYTFLLQGDSFHPACKPTSIPGLWIIPSIFDLAGAEIELIDIPSRDTLLKRKLFHVKQFFDYVLIDCPPSLGLLTLNAFISASHVVVPMQCEFLALEGLSHLFSNLKKICVEKKLNLAIAGVVLTMFDKKSNFNHEIVQEVHSFIPEVVFKTALPRSVKVAEASSHSIPVVFYKSSTVIDYFIAFASEFIERFKQQPAAMG